MRTIERVGRLLLLLSVAASSASAQRVSVGLLTGASASRLEIFGVEESRVRPTFGLGLYLGSGPRESGTVQILISQKGASTPQAGFHVTYLESPILSYLDLFAPSAPVQMFVGAGATPALLVGCRWRRTLHPSHDPPELEEGACADREDLGPSRLDLGFEARAGFRVGLGGGSLSAEARFVEGLLAPFASLSRARNRTLAFMVGYRIAPRRAPESQ